MVDKVSFIVEKFVMIGIIGWLGVGKFILLWMMNWFVDVSEGLMVYNDVEILFLCGVDKCEW